MRWFGGRAGADAYGGLCAGALRQLKGAREERLKRLDDGWPGFWRWGRRGVGGVAGGRMQRVADCRRGAKRLAAAGMWSARRRGVLRRGWRRLRAGM